ncbi:HU family DNA-binding protein [Pseudanabaena sp. PCC 6802]|uniref:HU family DNA-binding protein n=1 Tax=Pseudanabaena sp. PCC 6802 TaxID=118173 RepID=UPI00034808E4|nr:HU family DNA-binding protein [Pseudanabaena sp. PCC 6802]
MNQLELANVIAQELQIGGYDADRFLKVTLEKIVETVTTNQPVELQGFGTFAMRPNAPRTGTSPATGEPFNVPARWSASFKIDKAFKERVEAVPLDQSSPTVSPGSISDIITPGDKPYYFTVQFSDDVGIKASTIGGKNSELGELDVRVTGPNGFNQLARATRTKATADKKGRIVTYAVGAPGGVWDFTANGQYQIDLLEAQVSDLMGNFLSSTTVGNFNVAIPGGSGGI